MCWARFFIFMAAIAVILVFQPSRVSAGREGNTDGEGIDAHLLWPLPGPSNFATLASSDIIAHKSVAFSALLGYERQPLGLKNASSGKTSWVVKDAIGADFLWAFGLFDWFQFGVALPLVFDQNGKGAKVFQPMGSDAQDYSLASSALRDMRVDLKTRFLGGDAEIPDRRDFGLAFDAGLALPTGDELNFAGDEGAVFFPTAVLDFHRCKLSAALNLGARLRFKKAEKLANLEVGHQGTFGLGVTGHYFKRRLLLSAEGQGLVELNGFDRLGVEYRGAIGYIPDEARSLTVWLSGGSSVGTGDLLGTPLVRVIAGLTYAPQSETK